MRVENNVPERPMQDKIQFTPPTVHLFGDKPPPTSWFTENIIQYLQTKQQATVLQELIQHAQNLQGSHAAKFKKLPLLKLAHAPFPKTGTKQQMANTVVFNAAQPLMKTQIETLEKLLNQLKQVDPKLAKELDQDLAQLREMGKTFPKLSPDQLKKMSQLLDKLNQYAEKLPLDQKQKFLQTQFGMFKKLYETVEKEGNEFETDAQELAKKADTARLKKEIDMDLLEVWNSCQDGKMPKDQALKLFQKLQQLAKSGGELGESEQATLQQILSSFENLKGTNGNPLPNFLGKAVLEQVLASLLKARPNASPDEIKKALENFLKKSGLSESDLPFLKNIGQEMKKLILMGGFLIEDKKEGKHKADRKFFEELIAGFQFDPKSINVKLPLEQLGGEFDEFIQASQNMHQALSSGVALFAKHRENLGKSAAAIIVKLAALGSPPATQAKAASQGSQAAQGSGYDFASYLKDLLTLLANFGGQNYDLAKELSAVEGKDLSFALDIIKNFKNRILDDRSRCDQAIGSIDDEIKNIQNSNLPQAEKDKEIKSLSDLKTQLTTIKNNLMNLYNMVNSQHPPIVGPDKYGDTWMWQVDPSEFSGPEQSINSASQTLFTAISNLIPNTFQDFLNKLLEILKGFGSEDFHLLDALKGKSYSEAVAILNSYISNVEGAMGQCDRGSQAIDKEIDSIKNDPRYTQSEKDAMINQLNSLKTDLATTKKYLGEYLNELKNLKIKDNGSNGWSWEVPPPSDFGDAEKTARNLCLVTYNYIAKIAGATIPWSPLKPPPTVPPDGGGSLPDRFKRAILDYYMPRQEAFLMQMAALLYFDNMGSEIGNTLLGKMSDFGGAQFNYNFSGMMGSKTTAGYTGNYTAAKNALSKEKNQVSTDINNANDGINSINKQIQDVQDKTQPPPDRPFTPEQGKELLDKLNGYKANLQVALNQLNALKTILAPMQVVPGGDAQHFNINGLPNPVSALSSAENVVINGDNSSNPKGGLLNINTMITTDQSHYSSEGQNQQMKLQMTMTQVQQEWTVVSTALQLLNQMYMTVAQGVYK